MDDTGNFRDLDPKDIGETTIAAIGPTAEQRAEMQKNPGRSKRHGPQSTMDTKYDMTNPEVRERIVAERNAAQRLREEQAKGNSGEKGN